MIKMIEIIGNFIGFIPSYYNHDSKEFEPQKDGKKVWVNIDNIVSIDEVKYGCQIVTVNCSNDECSYNANVEARDILEAIFSRNTIK